MKIKLFLLSCLGNCIFTAPLSAAVLYSNFGQTNAGGAQSINSTSSLQAAEFRTGGAASTVSGLTLKIRNDDSMAHTYQAYLYSDAGDVPGSLLATFSPSSNSIAAESTGDVTFSHVGLNLTASSDYWIAYSFLEAIEGNNESDGGQYWQTAASNSVDAGSSYSNTSNTYSLQSNSTGTFWDSGSGVHPLMILESAAVPEPSRILFLLTALGALCLRRSRPAVDGKG